MSWYHLLPPPREFEIRSSGDNCQDKDKSKAAHAVVDNCDKAAPSSHEVLSVCTTGVR